MKFRQFLVALICLLPLAFGVNCYWNSFGGAIYRSSRYSPERLMGRTEEEVVELLGPPSYDPRRSHPSRKNLPATRNWNEAEDGPLSLAWYRGWAHCVVRFHNGRVIKVEHGMK